MAFFQPLWDRPTCGFANMVIRVTPLTDAGQVLWILIVVVIIEVMHLVALLATKAAKDASMACALKGALALRTVSRIGLFGLGVVMPV